MDKRTVNDPKDERERNDWGSRQDLHDLMKDLAPAANPNTAYYTRTLECLCSLAENGLPDYNYHALIRNSAQKLNLNPNLLVQSIDGYIQRAWYMGNKHLMQEIMSYNIDTKATPAQPKTKEFLNACFDYFNRQRTLK